MTVVIALKDKNSIWLGADRMLSGEILKGLSETPKFAKKPFTIYTPKKTPDNDGHTNILHENEETNYMIIAFAGDVGIFNHIVNGFKLPDKIKDDEFLTYLHLDFIPELQDYLRTFNLILRNNDGEDILTHLLIIYNNEIYTLFENLTYSTFDEKYKVIGGAQSIALGSLYTSVGDDPDYRIRLAINACAHHTHIVSEEMDIIEITEEDYVQ